MYNLSDGQGKDQSPGRKLIAKGATQYAGAPEMEERLLRRIWPDDASPSLHQIAHLQRATEVLNQKLKRCIFHENQRMVETGMGDATSLHYVVVLKARHVGDSRIARYLYQSISTRKSGRLR